MAESVPGDGTSWAERMMATIPPPIPVDPAAPTLESLSIIVDGHTVILADHATAITRALVMAPIFRFRAKAPSISGDPGPGFVRWNNTTQINSTVLAIDVKDQDELDVTLGLSVLKVGDKVYLQDFADAVNYQWWEIIGPGVNRTGWWDFPISHVASAGTGANNFVNGQMLALRITPASPESPEVLR